MGRRLAIEDTYDLRLPTQVAISPDGGRVAYVVRSVDRDADADRSALWVVDSQGGAPVQLTRGTADTEPAWSPDGRQLAFLRGAVPTADGGEKDGPAQIWLLPAGGGEARRLTELPLGAGAPVWSPDGTRIAFTAAVDLAGTEGEDEAAAARRRSDAPVVADRLGYKADGTGLLRTLRQHLFVTEVAGGEPRRLTWGDWHAGEPAWSPDGGRLAFSAAMAADADLTGESAAYVLDLGEPRPTPRLVGEAGGMAGPLTWTPDGDALLVVGRRDVRSGYAGLLRVPIDGGAPVDLVAALDRNVMPGGPAYPGGRPQVAPDGRTVLFCARDRGCTHLYVVDLAGGAPRKLVGGADRVVAGLAVARDADRCAVLLCDAHSFGEVAVVDLAAGNGAGDATGEAAARVLTDHALPGVELLAPQEREFEISDGSRVHGWLLRDPRAPRPGPLLLDVHGGPHNAWSPVADAVHAYHQVLAARGWGVLTLNVRGSDGYGERFFTAGLAAWGEADQRDFLEPLDRLVAEGVADPERLAVCGYSYGGFMTCFLTGRSDRFAAAVAGGVVSDLVSMAGASDLGHFMATHEFGGAPYERPERYAALSPYSSVEQVTTPTLILHGGADERCPAGQAEQWFAALRARRVPTRLVLYPGGSHLFILEGRPSHRADYCRRIVDWVSRYSDRKAGARPGAWADAGHWGRRLAALAERHKVPGATLGILRVSDPANPGEDELMEAAYGVLSKATGVEVTTDSLFQTGSICKAWTATVLMQLVDEGSLDLDQPVVEVLPELRLRDAEVTRKVTMRHLLTHTSGIDGDVFTDTGRGDDCLERYVAQLADVRQSHPLGATFSYCNSGFVLAGRVIERLTGMVWDQAMRERLFGPLGLTHTVTLPEEALLFRTAVGHVGEEPRPAPKWNLVRSAAPAGATLTSTARDLLSFARMHLAGGRTADGTQLLSAASVAAMQEHQVELPDRYSLGDSWGLGWIRFGWGDRRLFGHDGNTLGQSAFLRILPEQGLAVTLLTNGGHTRDLYHDLYREIFAVLAGVDMPSPLEPPADPPTLDPSPYLGTYERAGVRTEVFQRDGRLLLRVTDTSPDAGLVPEDAVRELELVAVQEGLYAMRMPEVSTWTPVTFYRLPDGTPYLHFGARANPKVA